MNELNQAYLHKLFTNGDKVYVFRFLRLVLHCCGRHTLIEIDLIRLEAVFAMLCTRWMCCTRCEVSSIFFKDVIKVGFMASKCWFVDLNEICWCASFVCWPKMVLVLHLLRSFLKIFMWTSPGAFDSLKVDVLDLFTSPGVFEILYQVFQKMNCGGSSHCRVLKVCYLQYSSEKINS